MEIASCLIAFVIDGGGGHSRRANDASGMDPHLVLHPSIQFASS